MGVFDLIRRFTGGEAAQPAKPEPALPVQPVSAAGSTGSPERRRKRRLNPLPGTRVLIIDDSPTIVAALRRMLMQARLEIFGAADGQNGLEAAFRHSPDLILLDIVMPGINGFNVLRALRRDERTRNIPVIMMSGNEQATEEFYVQRIGADGFMKKPFSRAEVFTRIERLLDGGLVPRRALQSFPDTSTPFADSTVQPPGA
jgi:CheY-like chemotaxis protein